MIGFLEYPQHGGLSIRPSTIRTTKPRLTNGKGNGQPTTVGRPAVGSDGRTALGGAGVAYPATTARMAHARAVNAIAPFPAAGMRSRIRSRRRARAPASSDMA